MTHASLNLGRAHAELGDAAKAVADFERFLDRAPPDHPDRDAVERLIRKLRP